MNINILSSATVFRVNKALVVVASLLILSLAIATKSYGGELNSPAENGKLSLALENIKKKVLKLNRDLFILEEDLLFPASTQIAVFVSVDVGHFFKVDSVELKINDKNVAGFLYTERQRKALEQGGIQRVYLGNLKLGKHQLTAIFTGEDGEGRTTQKAITHQFEKNDDVVMIELKIEDNESNYRANINVEEWIL